MNADGKRAQKRAQSDRPAGEKLERIKIDLEEMDRRLEAGEPVMTAEELRRARRALGLSVYDLAFELRMAFGGDREIRRMEAGKKDVSGPIATCVVMMLEEDGLLA